MASEAFDKVVDALEGVGSKAKDRRSNHVMFQCPSHEDKNPSLAVDDKQDRVMLRCHAGCATEDVVRELGLELKDLFDGEPDRDKAVPIRSYLYETGLGAPWFYKDRYYPKTFIQRLPGTDPGDRAGLKGRAPVLYHLPRLARALAAGDCTVWLVEGEKDVETCERYDLIATCTPGGAGAHWLDAYTDFLKAAKEVVIVADQDEGKPGELGKGQAHAAAVRTALRAAGIKVRIVAPAAGKDATDHFAAGLTVGDFKPEPTAFTRPRGMSAADLMGKEFTPLVFAVDKILPAGLAIMAGSPKAGKTWCALSFSLAVAAGGPALSCLPTRQGAVLHLAREDGYRRLQSRIALLNGGDMAAPKQLELIPVEQEWVGGEQGLANMTEWAEEVRNPRLVVIDTLAKVEPEMGEAGRVGAYAGNYTMMARYKRWADEHNCTVLLIHHDNKTKVEDGSDPFSRISGTRGITGAADTLLFLEKFQSDKAAVEGRNGVLHVTGRDVHEQSIDLYKTGPIWNAATMPE